MSKELEEIKCIVAVHFGALGFLNPIENEQILKDRDRVLNALNELQSIKESNPSEALKELKRIDWNITYLLSDCDINEEVSMNFNSIRDNKSCEVIKQALLKAQEPKKYLKWEDLEFTRERQFIKVKLNNTEYILKYYVSVLKEEMIEILGADKSFITGLSHTCNNDKQFFNDLHLERVEE